MLAETPVRCSCWMCGNPRRYFGEVAMQETKTEEFNRWDAADYLESEEDMRLYLEACAEEDAGDGSLILAAIGDIARAS